MKINIVYTGRSYHIAESLPEQLDLAADAKLDDALQAVNALLAGEEALPSSCLISVSGRHVGTLVSHENLSLQDQDEIILIAPVAGG